MKVKTKIIMPIRNGYLEPHFGRAEQFILYEIENGKVTDKTEIFNETSGAHKCSHGNGEHSESTRHHDDMAQFIKSNGADILVTCGIGPGAINNIKSQGIDVIRGIAPRKTDEIIYDFVDGKLKQDPEIKICRH